MIPVDSTWYLPNSGKDGRKEFCEVERIPNSIYFDIDAIKDVESPYPHMLPSLKVFNESMSELGVKKSDILVVYDRVGNFSAPRCAWTLGVFGHSPVYLLNNYITYKNEGYPIDQSIKTKFTEYAPTEYVSNTDFTPQQVISYDQMLDMVKNGELAKKYNVFDARALPRFLGEAQEPRPGLPSGHIPGAQPMPFNEMLNSGLFEGSEKEMKAKLDAYVSKSGVKFDPSKPTITMCGTGVSGVIIKTALELAGEKNLKLYDGSWTEWALRANPEYIVKGS